MQNRLIKTDDDIIAIKKAVAVIDNVYTRILCDMKEGVSEKQIASLIEQYVREEGGQGLSFDTIVAFGASGAEPHHVPQDDVTLFDGMLVTIDMGAVVDTQCSDFTRTFAFGKPSPEQIEIYNIVKQSQLRAADAVADGVACRHVDSVAREYIKLFDYGDNYIHGTGHGVGVEIHEAPTLNTRSEEVLKNGEVVTVEPGIYLKDRMGVRIEDMYIVGEKGKLSKHTTDLIAIL